MEAEMPRDRCVSFVHACCPREVNLSNPVTAVKPPGSDTPPSTESRDDGEEEVHVELVEGVSAGARTTEGSTLT